MSKWRSGLQIFFDMDNIFLLFENWYQNNKEDWKKKGILLINSSYEWEMRHSYALFFETADKLGEGQIILYESNGIYWLDLEGANFFEGDMYIKADIRTIDEKSLKKYSEEFFNHMIKRK